MGILKVNELTKVINKTVILDNINLTFKFGNIYGIKGSNGSGKTVLLKNICGLMIPTKGEIYLNEIEYLKKDGFLNSAGIIIEYPGFIKDETGYNNLKYLSTIKNCISDDDIKSAMTKVGLDYNDKRKVKKYSLGMNQRLGIAQAIMENPNILILDEPTNSLDEDAIEILRKIVVEYKNNNKLVIIASHDREFLDLVCDEVYIIKRGKIEYENRG